MLPAVSRSTSQSQYPCISNHIDPHAAECLTRVMEDVKCSSSYVLASFPLPLTLGFCLCRHSVYWAEIAAANFHSLFRAQALPEALCAGLSGIVFVGVMDDPHRPPKELAGVDWLWTQGARSEDRYERATGSASRNPEVSEAMRGVAKRTRIEPKDDKAEPWQQELREHAHVAQRPMNFEPTRMMFYCVGRPCVVQRKLYP